MVDLTKGMCQGDLYLIVQQALLDTSSIMSDLHQTLQ